MVMTKRHLLCTVLVVNTIPGAAASTPNQEIEALLGQFNAAIAANDFKRVSALFTPHGTYQQGNGKALPVADALRQAAPKRLPWDERMPLAISIQKIVFTRPDGAVVEALQSDNSPMLGTRTWSCTFVLVRSASAWKIAVYRESLPRHAFQDADGKKPGASVKE